ncbi:MAG: DinB family protein [Chloroflexi bacterium]|nr:MAG: DinB family protein [Chloroflexota bacterium]
MNVYKVIQSQYLAALAMLRQVIVDCSLSVWDSPDDKFKFWSKSYHVLFYVHLYLQKAEKDFVPWEKHHDPDGDVPFTKDEVLEYLSFVEQQVVERVPDTALEAESGFHWYPVNKLELQFINIRHIQQHTGELYESLGTRENIELGWVGFSQTHKENE